MNIDKATGEVLSTPRPITDTLRHLRGGEFLDEASEALQALVRAVDESGHCGPSNATARPNCWTGRSPASRRCRRQAHRSRCDVLDVPADSGNVADQLARAKMHYRAMASARHPDKGGSHDQMAEINRAWDEAQKAITESAAPTPNVSGESAQASQTDCAPSVAANQFKVGDRVMAHPYRDGNWRPATYDYWDGSNAKPHATTSHSEGKYMWVHSEHNIRRPTAAELALHWPKVLP